MLYLFFLCIVKIILSRFFFSPLFSPSISTHRILYNLGKVEDYTPEQLKNIGLKFYELGGSELKHLLGDELEEIVVSRFKFDIFDNQYVMSINCQTQEKMPTSF